MAGTISRIFGDDRRHHGSPAPPAHAIRISPDLPITTAIVRWDLILLEGFSVMGLERISGEKFKTFKKNCEPFAEVCVEKGG
jgi:hypothetical protein